MTIDYFSLGNPLAPVRSHYALRARQRMFERFMAFARPGQGSAVLDLGVTPDQSLPESNHFEQVYPYPQCLTAASIEPVQALRERFPQVNLVQIAPGPLPFADLQFEACFCSAVIEHVGDRDAQARFVAEVARVARRFVITTPNRWFPLEFHTFLPLLHWLPQPAHQAALRGLGRPFWARTENLNLLSAHELLRMVPQGVHAEIGRVRLFGLTSNLVLAGAR